MNWRDIASWMESTWLNDLMLEVYWLFPLMETLHFLALSVLFGSVMIMDLRVMGVARFINMQAAMKFIPVALIAFAVNFLTGVAFLFADPFRYFPNLSFQWKMGLIFIAGLNAFWFWIGEHRELCSLRDGEDAEFRAKVIATLSLLIWIGVIIGGRMIPYVEY